MPGLVFVKSNQEIVADEKKATAAQVAAEDAARKQEQVVSSLSSHILTLWEQAKRAKIPIEQQMLKNLRQRNGQYEHEKLDAIRAMGGSEVFMMLTDTKCTATEAWIYDVMNQDRPWSLDPSPIPDLPPGLFQKIQQQAAEQVIQETLAAVAESGQPVNDAEFVAAVQSRSEEIVDRVKSLVKEAAKKRADRMADKIEDEMLEGNWRQAFNEAISDLVTFPAGIVKGPVIRRKMQMSWVATEEGWQAQTQKNLVKQYYRVSPFDLYPEGDSTCPDDGYLFEVHRLSRKDLVALIGVPGYSEKAIRAALEEYGRGGLKETLTIDHERAVQENRDSMAMNDSTKIHAIEFWGSIQGVLLLEWGMDERKVPDPLVEYEVNVWQVGRHTIRAVINPDQTGHKIYSIASYERIPGSFWGRGLPEKIADIQEVCNAASRALVNNMGIASGPQVEVDGQRMIPGWTKKLYPWKVWETTNDQMKDGQAIRFYQPNLLAGELIKVFDHFSVMADEHTVPRFAHGDPNIGGAGNTASGLSMLISAASRAIKAVIAMIDAGIIEPTVQRHHDFVMRFDSDESIKGDVRAVAKGARSLMAREQRAIRINEFLGRTNNPLDFSIMGPEGRREALRESVKALEMQTDKVVPDGPRQIPTVLGQPQPGEEGEDGKPKTLNGAGQPAAGQDNAIFKGKKK